MKIKLTTRMMKLKRVYSDKVGVPVHDLRFLHCGQYLFGDDTPGELGMVEGDEIEVLTGMPHSCKNCVKEEVEEPTDEEEEATEEMEQGTVEGGVGQRVASLEKVIAATKKKRKAEEAEMEEIDEKLECADSKNREIKAELEELKRRKAELKERKAYLKEQGDGNLENVQKLTKKKQEMEIKSDATLKELKEQKVKLRRVLGEGMARDFLRDSIDRKARDLECPVCLTEAEPPIFGCRQFHLLCSACAASPGLRTCPTCREELDTANPARNRFAEKEAEEVREMRAQLAETV